MVVMQERGEVGGGDLQLSRPPPRPGEGGAGARLDRRPSVLGMLDPVWNP